MDSKDNKPGGDGLVNPDKFSQPMYQGKPPQLDFSNPPDAEALQDALFPGRKMERDMQEALKRNPHLLQQHSPQQTGWLISPKFIGLVAAGGLMALGYSANGSLSTGWGLISLAVGLGVFAWMNKLEAGS